MSIAPRIPVRNRACAACLTAVAALLVASASLAGDKEWPQAVDVKEGKIVMYQPQPETLEGNVLKSRAAVSILPKGTTEPVFGAVWLESQVEVKKDDREVKILGTRVINARIADSKPGQEERFMEILQEEIGDSEFKIDYDRLIASLQDAEVQATTAEGLRNDPPKIIIEYAPAILVVIDGQPTLRAIPDSDLERVVNTPFFIVKKDDRYWLNGGEDWFSTKEFTGEWERDRVPVSVNDAWKDDLKRQGTTPAKAEESKDNREPKIIAATEPTELIVIDGEAQYRPIVGDELLYVSNSESDVFMEVASQNYFVLLSGRWYRSKSMDGPWQYVQSDALPECFVRIPTNSDKSQVRVFVAGTQEAKEAVLDSQVPQTAAINRAAATLTVTYDGEPKFEPIPKTSIELAQNTDKTVMKIDGRYYCCENAVWFIADAPKGPWAVCDRVPDEVQKIPPESAAYNTKYVYIYESTPEVVYVGYTPAYVGCYPYYGSIVYGTGWYYPPYVSPHYYYPRPCTWGFHVNYNPWTGWSCGMSWSNGWAHFSVGFGGGGGWWGPPGYAWRPNYPAHHGNVIVNRPVNINTGNRVSHHNGQDNLYQRPSTRPAVADRETAARNRPGSSPGVSTREAKPSRSRENNVYADQNGNVMRRENDGSWSQRDQGSWKPADGRPQSKDAATRPGGGASAGQQPATRPGGATPGTQPATRPATPQTRPSQPNTQQLNRDYQSRQRGNQRVNNYQGQTRSRPSSRPAGRSGGGGRRR
ncbi:MAG TPA: carbohydrate-binding family V/XII [Candidatus Krumholzibacteria bacterium]|nr:carbohydrate-binding family V/XII [Candidatus Krumholzibacteria bacterium]